MTQNSSEWDCEPDALKQWTVEYSHWGKGNATSLHRSEEEEPFQFESLWHKYAFEAFPVVTYIRKSTHAPCRQCSLSSAGCLLTYAVMETSAKLLFFEGYFKGPFLLWNTTKFLAESESYVWYSLCAMRLKRKKKKFFESERDQLCVFLPAVVDFSRTVAQAWGGCKPQCLCWYRCTVDAFVKTDACATHVIDFFFSLSLVQMTTL